MSTQPPLIPIGKPGVHWDHGTTWGSMTPRSVVLHSAESDGSGAAYGQAIVGFWQRQGEGLGAHFIVARDGAITQAGHINEVMYHCGGANYGYVGIEQAGYASFTHAQWMRRIDELRSTAKLLAWLHHDPSCQLRLRIADSGGVSTHAMQSLIHPESLGHTDPGPGYPLDYVLWLAERFVRLGGWNE